MNAWLQMGLSNALAATALAIVVWLVTRWWRKPQVALVLWSLVLVKLVAPPLVLIPLLVLEPEASEPIEISEAEIVSAFELLAAPPTAPMQFEPSERLKAGIDVPLGARPLQPDKNSFAPTSHVPPAEAPTVVAAATDRFFGPHLESLFLWAWFVGSLFFCGQVAVRCFRFARVLARAEVAPTRLQEEVAQLAVQLRLSQLPRVRLTGRALPPLVWAVGGRPTLLLPADLIESLTDQERAALIMHELVHLKRRDHWAVWFKLSALACYWWHPVAWWATRQIERATELCCDARVVALRPEHAREYAQALLATVDYLSEARPALPLGSQAFSRVPALKRRLEMILAIPQSIRLGWPTRVALLMAAACVLTLSPTVVSAEPGAQAKASASALEQRLDRLEKMVEALTAEVRALREVESENTPATVVKSIPETGATDVDPSLNEIRVTFSKDMRNGSWSWTQRSDDTYPEVTDKPHYVDKRTCVLPVKLKPGTTYYIGINSQRFGNFKDASGRSAVPFSLSFTTKP